MKAASLRTISQVAEMAETDVVTAAHLPATVEPEADISVAKAAMRQLVVQAATQVAAVAEEATTPVVLEASVASPEAEVAVVPQRQAETVAMAVLLPLAAVMVVLAVAVLQEAAVAARRLVARFSRTVAHSSSMHVRLPTTWPAAALQGETTLVDQRPRLVVAMDRPSSPTAQFTSSTKTSATKEIPQRLMQVIGTTSSNIPGPL